MKKIKPEDVASELRLLSKNWCLSPEVINIISHGYARICELERERDEARRIACLQSCMGDDEPREWSPEDFAKQHGWDCFKENTNA